MINVAGAEEVGGRLLSRLLREAFAQFPSGVVAICGDSGGEVLGMAASSFTSVSLDPPLVGYFVDRGSRTWPRLRELPRIGVSVLGEGQDAVAHKIAARDGDRFAGVPLTRGPGDVPLVTGATAWFECRLHAEADAGDHLLVLLEVIALDADRRVQPLVFHRSKFHALHPAEG